MAKPKKDNTEGQSQGLPQPPKTTQPPETLGGGQPQGLPRPETKPPEEGRGLSPSEEMVKITEKIEAVHEKFEEAMKVSREQEKQIDKLEKEKMALTKRLEKASVKGGKIWINRKALAELLSGCKHARPAATDRRYINQKVEEMFDLEKGSGYEFLTNLLKENC